jgi:hypothetical protein
VISDSRLPRRDFLAGLAAAGLLRSKTAVAAMARPLPAASFSHLPRWRGFNLLEKFTLANNHPYVEWDYDFIANFGFDFVRLPLDYRIWTSGPDQFQAAPLREIDQAIAWARARGIHTCLCLHRAPGYCVNPPKEALDLWGDGAGGDEARRQFAGQWRMFAARYRGIPADQLSFNLVNEPPSLAPGQYRRTAAAAVTAIRTEDPARLIIADGVPGPDFGRLPVPELVDLRIAQSARGYTPASVSHYQAAWVTGSDAWPLPVWPVPAGLNNHLYGDRKPALRAPLSLSCSLAQTTKLTIHVETVSAFADLRLRADGRTVWEKQFRPGPGTGEWKQSTYFPEWKIYQALYQRDYTAQLPAGTRNIVLDLTAGDWLTFSAITLDPFPGVAGGRLVLQPRSTAWGQPQIALVLRGDGRVVAQDGAMQYDRPILWTRQIAPWIDFAQRGIGVHVGEWGAYNRTPHDVVLAWMTDCLANWKQAGIGWALWNLRGGFGPIDSQRQDVAYESYGGHQLDRRMLALLQQG